jgi:hypothetical protein
MARIAGCGIVFVKKRKKKRKSNIKRKEERKEIKHKEVS